MGETIPNHFNITGLYQIIEVYKKKIQEYQQKIKETEQIIKEQSDYHDRIKSIKK